jgi:hypothetical protein
MSIENLLLSQQMRETQRNIENVMDRESDRRKRGGLFASTGGLLGGGLGTLLGLAFAPTLGVPMALAAGLGGGAGTLLGARGGLELGGGRSKDATPIGMNRSAITGEEKEFGQSVKDRYRRSVGDFQESLNNRILSNALSTGIKAAAFAGMNTDIAGKLGNRARDFLGMEQGLQPATANLAAAQAYDPFSDNLVRSNPLNTQPLAMNQQLSASLPPAGVTTPVVNPASLTPVVSSGAPASSTGTVGLDSTLPFSNTDIFAPGEVDFIGPMQGSPTTSNANMNQGNNFLNLIMPRLMGAIPTLQAPGINQNQNIIEAQRLYDSPLTF